MAKWDYLLEAEDELRRIFRRNMDNPRELHRALARVRGSNELVDKWDELSALNARAGRIRTESAALAWAKDVLSSGFCVFAQYLGTYDQNLAIAILTSPDHHWFLPGSRPYWSGAWRLSRQPDAIGNIVYVEYSRLASLERVGARPEQIIRAYPVFAAIPHSALPPSIKQAMASGEYDKPPVKPEPYRRVLESKLLEADETLRRTLRNIKATHHGKIPQQLRDRYDLCTCVLVTCPHCENNFSPIYGPVCENPAELTITHVGTQRHPDGLIKRVCKPCGQAYLDIPHLGWQIQQ